MVKVKFIWDFCMVTVHIGYMVTIHMGFTVIWDFRMVTVHGIFI